MLEISWHVVPRSRVEGFRGRSDRASRGRDATRGYRPKTSRTTAVPRRLFRHGPVSKLTTRKSLAGDVEFGERSIVLPNRLTASTGTFCRSRRAR